MERRDVERVTASLCAHVAPSFWSAVFRRPAVLRWLVPLACVALCACGDPRDLTAATSEELSAALGRAVSGERVVLTAAEYTGQFSVPAGVTLDGNGARISGTGAPVLRVAGGDATATLVINLRIASRGVGLLSNQGRVLSLADVSFDVQTGAGLVVSGVERVELARVALRGSVTEADLPELGDGVDPSRFAALGLAVRDAEIELTDVQVNGFAGFGAVFANARGLWNGGSARGNVGPALVAEGSQLNLSALDIREGRAGELFGSDLPAGAVISAGSVVITADLIISDIDGPGILQDGAASAHTALEVDATDYAGVWVQNAGGVERALALSGDSRFTRTRGSGIHLRSVSGVLLEGVTVSGTTRRSSQSSDSGDGIQALGLGGEVTFRNTELIDNERAGLLFDGQGAAGAEPLVTVDGLSIRGSGEYGLLIQNSTRDFRAQASIDAPLDQNDRDARGMGLSFATQADVFAMVPLGGRVSESGIIGEDGQLIPWTPETAP